MSPFVFAVVDDCPDCGRGRLRVCSNKKSGSKFVGCSRFPSCKYVDDFDEYVQMLAAELKYAHEVIAAYRRAA